MEQGGSGGGRGGGDGRRGEVNKQIHNHPQPQKCPRCDSFNTKFCYYNNYSLSQPRFFCKTCRRYWTQGGTLRNVPVGGGCRKGKRPKNSATASSSNSIGNFSLTHTHPHAQSALQQSTDQSTIAALTRDPSSVLASYSSTVPYYQGGVGYMSSFAAFNPALNPNLSTHNYNQSLGGVGVGVGSSSNLGLLQGFNVAAAALGNSSQGQNRPSQFFQMGGNCGPMFTSEQQGLSLIPPSNMINSNSVSGSGSASDNWPQTYINNTNNTRISEQSLWSTVSTTSISGANSDRNGGTIGGISMGNGSGSGGDGVSAPLGPNQWPDLSGFNPQ